MKLYLGCGDNYLEGYTNIDFPEDNTVQKRRKAPDIIGDFTTMNFDNESCNEVRLHHVFEHFQRHIAISFVCKWNRWLEWNGKLTLAMPDIEECIKQFGPAGEMRKRQLIRHMWGSHEANWATHHEGWYPGSAYDMLEACGFMHIDVVRNNGQWPEFIITGLKRKPPELNEIARFLFPYDFRDGMLKNWLEKIKSEIK